MTDNQRKWAIEEIENSILPDACDEVAERALGYAIEALSNERPKGRWVGIQSEKFIGYDELGEPMYRLCSYYTCQKCGRKTVVKTNYCPNCGAEMVRGEEE